MFVVRNQTIPYGMQADVEFYDTDNNLLEASEERMFMPVSTLKSQLPDDTYIDPNYLSDNDTVLLCATKRIICSPKDHIHTSGAKAYDIFEHYELCKTCGKKCLIRFILIANHLIKEESIGMLTSSLPIQQMADGIKNAAAAIMNLIHLQFPKKQSDYC